MMHTTAGVILWLTLFASAQHCSMQPKQATYVLSVAICSVQDPCLLFLQLVRPNTEGAMSQAMNLFLGDVPPSEKHIVQKLSSVRSWWVRWCRTWRARRAWAATTAPAQTAPRPRQRPPSRWSTPNWASAPTQSAASMHAPPTPQLYHMAPPVKRPLRSDCKICLAFWCWALRAQSVFLGVKR